MFKAVDDFLNNFEKESVESVDPVDPAEPAEPVEPVEAMEPVEPADPVEVTEPVEPAPPVEVLQTNDIEFVKEKSRFSGLFNFFTKYLVCSSKSAVVIDQSNKPVEIDKPDASVI